MVKQNLVKHQKVSKYCESDCRCSSCIVIENQNFKIFPFLPHGYHTPQLENIAILMLLSHPTISKFYHHVTWNFFGLVIPLRFFLHKLKLRQLLLLISTIISNITVLECHTILFALDILFL